MKLSQPHVEHSYRKCKNFRIVLAEKERRTGKHGRRKRKVITGNVYRWPKDQPIPFELAASDGLFCFEI